MSETHELSTQEIQQLLDENRHLIKVILTCQNEGRIMDAMLYQTRLQLNLVQLASSADNCKHPSLSTLQPTDAGETKVQTRLNRFTRAVNEMGFRNLNALSEATDIPIDKIGPLAVAYVNFLKRQNRFGEANGFEKQLLAHGISATEQ